LFSGSIRVSRPTSCPGEGIGPLDEIRTVAAARQELGVERGQRIYAFHLDQVDDVWIALDDDLRDSLHMVFRLGLGILPWELDLPFLRSHSVPEELGIECHHGQTTGSRAAVRGQDAGDRAPESEQGGNDLEH
jgi:hypothetical protein